MDILVTAGVRHWHGAAPDTRMAHLATNTNPQTPGAKWYSFPKQAGRGN